MELFSDGLPVRLPIWHSVQQSNKKFSRTRNQFDLDIVPDYGGHMLYYDKKTNDYQPIKHDCLGKSPFIIKSHLIPYRISLESTSDLPNDKFTNQCLVCDHNLLISTESYNHPIRKRLLIKELDFDDDEIDKVHELNLDSNHGNIEQLNRFVDVAGRTMTHVRQERCLSVFELKKTISYFDIPLTSTNQIVLSDPNELYFYSHHNPIIGEYLISGSIADRKVKLNEIDIETNSRLWSTNFQTTKASDRPLQVKCTEYHPKMFYYSSSNEVKVYDTRHRSPGSLKIDRNRLRSLSSIECFKQISNSILNPNYVFVASNYNLMLFDIRYPHYALLQWNHMLSSDSEVSFLRSLKLEKETVFVATREEISSISIDKPESNLIHPTSLHFPLHLPKLKNLIKSSTIADLRLENYMDQAKIVGLDFAMRDGQEFDLFMMNQFGDLFRQKLSKTNLENANETVMQLEPNSTNVLDQNLEVFREKLLNRRRMEVKNSEESLRPNGNSTKRKYWSKFANNLELNEVDKIRQEMVCSREEMGNFNNH